MFGRGRIKTGDYIFVVRKDGSYNDLVIGKVQSLDGTRIRIKGTFVHPAGLIERIESGIVSGRPKEVLNNPDPNNCIFMLIDKVETGIFNEDIDQNNSKVTWINEKRFYVLDGWLRENLPDMFAEVLRAKTEEQRLQARSTLIEKMNSLYEKDLKDHLYAVARSTKVL
jgi:hypothetical protein